MNLTFFGSGAFGVPTLEALACEHRLVGVVTQPDRPAGRGGGITPTPVAEFAARALAGVPVLEPENVNEPAIVAQVLEWRADAAVVIAFGQKLSAAVLPGEMRAVNLHA